MRFVLEREIKGGAELPVMRSGMDVNVNGFIALPICLLTNGNKSRRDKQDL